MSGKGGEYGCCPLAYGSGGTERGTNGAPTGPRAHNPDTSPRGPCAPLAVGMYVSESAPRGHACGWYAGGIASLTPRRDKREIGPCAGTTHGRRDRSARRARLDTRPVRRVGRLRGGVLSALRGSRWQARVTRAACLASQAFARADSPAHVARPQAGSSDPPSRLLDLGQPGARSARVRSRLSDETGREAPV
jgi:hypothetical protein